MLCAKCLYDQTIDILNAVTIANGNAFCGLHFEQYKNRVSPDASGVAVNMLDYEGFSRTGA